MGKAEGAGAEEGRREGILVCKKKQTQKLTQTIKYKDDTKIKSLHLGLSSMQISGKVKSYGKRNNV